MLAEKKCVSCSLDAVALDEGQYLKLQQELDGWLIELVNGIPQLIKSYKFKNYKLAWAFANKVSELAETEFHHPSITLEWGKVTVVWWSHSIKGLHENDFVCAAKCDLL